jgi:predicted RNase H-like nuclease (RuvC/YqgF family)
MNESIIVAALVGAASGLIPLLWRRKVDMAGVRRDDAEAAERVTEAALELLEPLKARVTELERLSKAQAEEIKRLKKQLVLAERKLEVAENLIAGLVKKLEAAEKLINGLVRQLKEAGIQPRFGAMNRSAKGGEEDDVA